VAVCIQSIAAASQALLTPVIAIVATYIAWQQWQTNKRKLVLDRYDRRLRVYEEVRKILSIITRKADVDVDEMMRFRTSVSEADFLFGPEIPEYLDQIYKQGLDLWRWCREYRDYTQEKPVGYDHEKVVAGKHAALEWLVHQFDPAKEKFKKYLDVSK
jgi:hypothetical protein